MKGHHLKVAISETPPNINDDDDYNGERFRTAKHYTRATDRII